jgi:hypothetical protein
VSIRWPAPLSVSGSVRIGIRGPDGERVPGTASLRDGETVWRFVPGSAWRAGAYALVLHPSLEDVAGNRPCAPFEARGLGAVECAQAERPFALAE